MAKLGKSAKRILKGYRATKRFYIKQGSSVQEATSAARFHRSGQIRRSRLNPHRVPDVNLRPGGAKTIGGGAAGVVRVKAHIRKGRPVRESTRHLGGYVKGNTLTDWKGKTVVAQLKRVSTWKTPLSNPFSTSRSAYRATVGGVEYHGRGYGEGMSLILRPRRRR